MSGDTAEWQCNPSWANLVRTAVRIGCGSQDRVVTDRNRHRPRKSKSPSAGFGHAGQHMATRIAGAVITMANAPA
jgi:hypothetical protein